MSKRKESIPPFLKGKSIKSDKYSRVDSVIDKSGWKTVLFEYDIDCIDKTHNRKGAVPNWNGLVIDQTPFLISQKYCPLEEWSNLPNR